MRHAHAATRLDRRQFVLAAGAASLGPLAGCGRLPWQAAPPQKTPRLGELWPFAPGERQQHLAALQQGLRDLGYVEGQNLLVERRFAGERIDQLPDLATELVQLPVDLIVTLGTPGVRAAKQATSSVPIVFAQVGDPVQEGIVASLARPGGNVTGLFNLATNLAAKRLQLLHEMVPGLERVAALHNAETPPSRRALAEAQDGAKILDLQLLPLSVQRAEDFTAAFETAVRDHAGAMLILEDFLLATHMARLGEMTLAYRLPAIGVNHAFCAAGGLMAYGSDLVAQFRRSATYIDKILKGTKPADLPVEQPRVFEFVFNDKTAQALGLTIPYHVRLQITEVIS